MSMPQQRAHASHAARQAAYRKRQTKAREEELRKRGLPPLPAIATMPGNARWSQAIAVARCLLTEVAEEMQAYFEERSEQWQESERGEPHQQRVQELQDIVDALETVWT